MVWPDFVPRTRVKKILAQGPEFECLIVDTKPHFSYNKWRFRFLGRWIGPRGGDLLGGITQKFAQPFGILG